MHAHKKIVFCNFGAAFVHKRAGRYNLYYLTAHNAFCFCGIFRLLAYGNLITSLNKPRNIVVYAVKRYAAHWRALLLTAILACQGKLKLF